MKFSTIIPVYNGARYIAQTLDSALAQTCKDHEIIVVDDGSTDETPTIVASYASRVRYIRQPNRGLPAARNIGISAAQGAYIAVLDADDLWLPAFLTTLAAILDENDRIGAVYCGFQCIDGSGTLLPHIERRIVSPERLYELLLSQGNFLSPHTVLARRTCYKTLGMFDESLLSCADTDMWLRIAHACGMMGIPQVLAFHRVHPESMSTDPQRAARYRLAVIQKHVGPGDGNQANWPMIKRHAYANAYLWSAIRQFQAGQGALGRSYLRQAFQADPQLASRLDAFYELALADQPKGWRGDLSTPNIDGRAQALLAHLDDLFAAPNLPSDIRKRRRQAYANAYLALGMIAYAARDMGHARAFLLRAARTDHRHAYNWRIWSRVLKSLLGVKIVNRFSRRRQDTVDAHPGPI